MKYFRIKVSTPYCGTDDEEYIKAEDQATADEYAEEYCRQWAESYEYLVSGWDDENFEDLTEEQQQDELDNYYADCTGIAEEISYEEYCEETGDYE